MPILLKPSASSSSNSESFSELLRDSGEVIIGRGQGSDILLASPMVSRRHCVVSGSGSAWQVTDASASGTLLNGRRVAGTQSLREGDVITVADVELVVTFPDAGVPASPRDPRLNLDSWGRPAGSAEPTTPSWPAPAAAAAHGDGLTRLLHAAGVDRRSLPADDVALALALGGVLQACLAGLAQLTRDRQQARVDLGVPASSVDGNPLLQPGGPEQVLARLLTLPPTAARDAMVDATRELDRHQRATLGAMQGTFAKALDHFAPTAIRQRTSSEAAAWKAYERAFAEQDGFADAFARELARNYAALGGG